MKVRRGSIGFLFACISLWAPASGKPEIGDIGIDPSAANANLEPGEDFYDHVNGHWLASTQIPPDVSRWNDDRKLREIAAARVRDIVQTASVSPTTDNERKFGTFYATYMDESAIAAKGYAPINDELAVVDRIRTKDDLALAFARFERLSSPFGFNGDQSDFPITVGATIDVKNPTRYLGELAQAGLGLPDRDYYLTSDPESVSARAAYRRYIVTLFGLVGFSEPERRADAIIALETKIAVSQMPSSDARDITKIYNVMTPAELEKRAPGFNWSLYLAHVQLGGQSKLIVDQPDAMAAFGRLVQSEAIGTWRDYLALRIIGNAAPFLPAAFVDADFAYLGKALTGTPAMRPRWKRGVQFDNVAMGDAIGQTYARRWFPASSKTATLAMVSTIKTAMAARIDRLPWMAPETKVRAKRKLANLLVEVGYPDHWRDYSGLEIVAGDAVGNAERANAFQFDFMLGHLNHPVDRTEWDLITTPQLADALNYGPQVALVFPAAFLAPPFFDPQADPAVNYGAIGATIGHEITHSFDDQGAKLDESGRLDAWWTPSDEAAFKAATDQLAAQYDTYSPLPGQHINGRLTLGENTADLGGVLAALDAYHSSLGGRPAPILDGLTGDQRFFISYAQSYRELNRPEALRKMIATNPHSPGRYRVATLRNVDDWYAAFKIGSDHKMALEPADRVRIW
jgi:putative endopeptidase